MALDKLLTWTTAIYLSTALLAIQTGIVLDAEDSRAFGENVESLANPLMLLAWILIMTGAILYMIKLKKGFVLLRSLEVLALFSAGIIVISSVTPASIALPASLFFIGLLIWRQFNKDSVILKNSFAVLAAAGVGAIIGVSLGVLPILLFMVLLAAYDFIAVFKTKHMVTMAKSLTGKGYSMMCEIPTKKHTFQLGTGDLAMPVGAGVSTMIFISPLASAFVFIGAYAGLLWTLRYVSKNVGKALPAIPPITIGIIIGLAAFHLIQFTGVIQ